MQTSTFCSIVFLASPTFRTTTPPLPPSLQFRYPFLGGRSYKILASTYPPHRQTPADRPGSSKNNASRNKKNLMPKSHHLPSATLALPEPNWQSIRAAINSGSPDVALDLFLRLPLPHLLPHSFVVGLAHALTMCPLVTKDQRPEWTTMVAAAVDRSIQSLDADHKWRVPARYVAMLARSVARRQLRTHAHCFTRLLHVDDSVDKRSKKILNSNVIDMYVRVNQPADAIQYFSSIHKNEWSIAIVVAVCRAHAILKNNLAVRNLMLESTDAGLLIHPFASDFLNNVYLKSFASLEDAISGLESISHELRSASYGQSTSPNSSEPITSFIISDLLQRCVSATSPSLAERVLAVSDKHSISRDAAITGWMIALRVHARDFRGGLDLYHSFIESGQQITVPMMYPVIELLAELDLKDQLIQTHNDLLESHCRNKLTLTTMYSKIAVRAFASAFNPTEASHRYEEMLKKKVPVHVSVRDYISYITSARHARKLHVSDIKSPVSDMNDEQSYMYHIKPMLLANQPVPALMLWKEMVQNYNIPATTASLCQFVSYFANRGDAENVDRVIELSQKIGVRDSPRYNAIIVTNRVKAYNLSNRHQDSFRVWDEFLASGGVPPAAMQCLILDACGHTNDHDRLSATVDRLMSESWGGLDENTWTSAVEAYCRMHRLPCALDLLEKARSRKQFSLTTKLVGTLLTVEPGVNKPFLDSRAWMLVDEVGGPIKFHGVKFPRRSLSN